MERKYITGNIYGSRVSKSGKWLNFQIIAKSDEMELVITCPVRIADGRAGFDKPYAFVDAAEKKGSINGVQVFEAAAESPDVQQGDLPF